MSKEILIDNINTIWDSSVKKTIMKLDSFFQTQISPESKFTSNFPLEAIDKLSELFSPEENATFGINIFNKPQELYTTLKKAVISEWIYRNFPEYALGQITINDLCSKAHCKQKDKERIRKKVLKSCKRLLEPTVQHYNKWTSLYSELFDATENDTLSSVYSYNATYQIICNWDELLEFVQNDNTFDIFASMQSLLTTIAADTQTISGSKTGLGCIAPNYIMQQFYEELLCPYFFLDLFRQLIYLKTKIERKIKNEIITSLDHVLQEYNICFDINHLDDSTLQSSNTNNYLDSFKYRYDHLQTMYFIFLYNAIRIGKYPSYIMKNYYLTCLKEQFNMLFFEPKVNYNYSLSSVHSFDKQLKLCNVIYNNIYNSFSKEMRTRINDIKVCLNTNNSLFDIYFKGMSNFNEELYSDNEKLLQITYYTDDIKAILNDLLETKTIGYRPLPTWGEYYPKCLTTNQVMAILTNTFQFNPVSLHFKPLKDLFSKSNKENRIFHAKLLELNTFSTTPHIIYPDPNTSK